MLSDQLIPIRQIIKLSGTDKTHLSYLAKLHLIPSAIRRKLSDGKISGCYPESVVGTLQKIEDLKNQGLNYSQIKAQLGIINSSAKEQSGKFNLALAYTSPIFLIIGIILGYMLATSAGNKAVAYDSQISAPMVQQESNYQKVLRVSAQQDGNQKQTLYKTGETNLNSLTK